MGRVRVRVRGRGRVKIRLRVRVRPRGPLPAPHHVLPPTHSERAWYWYCTPLKRWKGAYTDRTYPG